MNQAPPATATESALHRHYRSLPRPLKWTANLTALATALGAVAAGLTALSSALDPLATAITALAAKPALMWVLLGLTLLCLVVVPMLAWNLVLWRSLVAVRRKLEWVLETIASRSQESHQQVATSLANLVSFQEQQNCLIISQLDANTQAVSHIYAHLQVPMPITGSIPETALDRKRARDTAPFGNEPADDPRHLPTVRF